MSKLFKPYCYLIGWSHLNTWYYGSEYGSNSKTANPENLWTTYFTSSKHVKEFRLKHGEPDIIEIRKTFDTKEETILWEYKVLQRLNVRYNNKWLNVNEGKAPIGIPWSETKKALWSTKRTGDGNPRFGKHLSDETKNKISQKLTGKPSVGMLGKKHSDETRQKMRNNSTRTKTFRFQHSELGIEETTVQMMLEKYPDLKKSGLRNLCCGNLKTYKGWIMLSIT